MTQAGLAADRRSSWLPSWPLVGAKLLELRKRRVLITVIVLFTVGIPVLFLGIREIAHLADPKSFGPPGSPGVFATTNALINEFAFVVAVTLGATAGTTDLTDGMFRHLVITGRSRLALFLARIPAGLAIILPLAGLGIAIVCLVTAFLGSQAQSVNPSAAGMLDAGLWIELDLVIGFTAGLGIGSLMGQRTVPIILMTFVAIIITPLFAAHQIPYFIDGQRLLAGVAMDQIQPAALTGGATIGPGAAQGVGHPALQIPPMPTWAVAAVIAGWVIGWSAIGAWRMRTRDA
jgi:hypothetical protein